MNIKMSAYSYLRVSGKSQVDGDGFPRQREVIADYANRNGIVIADEFRDEGVSGTTELQDREALGDLFIAVASNGIKTVLVERSDRLARDLLIGEVILNQFRDAGVTLIEAATGNVLTADNADPTKILIRQILGAVAQFDKSMIVSKLKTARERMRKKEGRCEGIKPYGTLDGEQIVLSRMKSLRRARKGFKRRSYREIATVLTSEGFVTRSGKPWNGTTIRNILARG